MTVVIDIFIMFYHIAYNFEPLERINLSTISEREERHSRLCNHIIRNCVNRPYRHTQICILGKSHDRQAKHD